MFVKGDPRLPSYGGAPALDPACSAAGGRQVLLLQDQLGGPEAVGLGLSPHPPAPQWPLPHHRGLTISDHLRRLWGGQQCRTVMEGRRARL